MKKINIIAIIVFIGILLTTCSIPGLYGRWSLESYQLGCPQEIIISKERYNSGITMAERMNATLTTFDANRQVIDSPTYSMEHLDGDLYGFNPGSYSSITGFVPKYMKVNLTFEGRKLLFKKVDDKKECKYKLEADYQLIGKELFGDLY